MPLRLADGSRSVFAQKALQVADEYDALAADGRELVPTMPAPGYYPPPLRRTRAEHA